MKKYKKEETIKELKFLGYSNKGIIYNKTWKHIV